MKGQGKPAQEDCRIVHARRIRQRPASSMHTNAHMWNSAARAWRTRGWIVPNPDAKVLNLAAFMCLLL